MKALHHILLLTFLLLLAGCSKNEFSISFELPADSNQSYRIAYYGASSRGGIYLETVAAIVSGKGSATGHTRYPSVVFISSPSSPLQIAIYAEKGNKIKIAGSSSDPTLWDITGNKLNEELSAWRHDNAEALRKADRKAINAAVAKYVKDNPSHQLSTFLLFTTYSRRDDEEGYRNLRGLLKGDALDERLLNACSRCDNIDELPASPARVARLVVHSFANGIDEIHCDSMPALIYFWAGGVESRSQTIDTIRSLSRQFPDSASRILMDVSIDADSMAWAAPLRSDSLRKTVRAWMPMGLADPRLRKMPVARVPFIIVTDAKGRQTYRGDDPAKAADEFRRQMHKQ